MQNHITKPWCYDMKNTVSYNDVKSCKNNNFKSREGYEMINIIITFKNSLILLYSKLFKECIKISVYSICLKIFNNFYLLKGGPDNPDAN